MRRGLLAAVPIVLLCGGFYLVLIDTVSLPELYAVAGVLVLAVVAFQVSRLQGLTSVSLEAEWLRGAWRPLVRAPQHVAIVSWEAIAQLVTRRPARGEFRAVPFRCGETGAGRFALTETLGSFTPNTIVIGIDDEHELLLVHQLRRQGGRDELDVLRLG